MHKIKKIIYWISLTLILLLAVVPFIGHFTPLEITNENFLNIYEQICFFGLPIVILLTLIGTLRPQNSDAIKTIKITLTICASLFSPIVLLSTFFLFGMCRWTDNEVLFRNLHDNSTQIILRDFGCGATDSGRPIYKVFKRTKILPSLIWVTDFDTTKIDRQVWQRIEN